MTIDQLKIIKDDTVLQQSNKSIKTNKKPIDAFYNTIHESVFLSFYTY